MTWNYRVIRRTYEYMDFSENIFSLHEVFYEDDNKTIKSWSSNPCKVEGSSLGDLVFIKEKLELALSKPFLIEVTRNGKTTLEEIP